MVEDTLMHGFFSECKFDQQTERAHSCIMVMCVCVAYKVYFQAVFLPLSLSFSVCVCARVCVWENMHPFTMATPLILYISSPFSPQNYNPVLWLSVTSFSL